MTHALPSGPGPHFIGIGNGKHVSVGTYVAGIRLAKAHPERTFSHGLGGWWPETGAEILRDFRRHLDVVINRKAGIPDGERSDGHLALCAAIKAGRITRRCKWCGGTFTPKTVNDWFDDPSCARSYYN